MENERQVELSPKEEENIDKIINKLLALKKYLYLYKF